MNVAQSCRAGAGALYYRHMPVFFSSVALIAEFLRQSVQFRVYFGFYSECPAFLKNKKC